MEKYIDIILKSYTGYWRYLKYELIDIYHWDNYFYGLIVISLLVWALEVIFPWRKGQSIFREDFWLDTFYMFFNFFLLNLIVLIALSNTVAEFFNEILGVFGWHINSLKVFSVNDFPRWLGLFIFFIITDFVQWNTHRLLHRVPWLWNFHKVHHSVKEMGFAAHLRYHWMEPVVYNSLLYIPIAILGWNYGPLKYILNNPKMHIWHHVKELPEHATYGINYGLTLSVWDYIFKTDHIPHDGRDIEIGFDGDEEFPKTFIKQSILPIKTEK